MNWILTQKKILVIEDENGLRKNIAEILSLENYRTFTAANGRKGIEIAQKEIPDIILCDIMMPDMDGYDVLKCLAGNQTLRNIPFIFLTALDERNFYRKGMELGADDYLTKPFSREELLNAIHTRIKKFSEQQDTIQQKFLENRLKNKTPDKKSVWDNCAIFQLKFKQAYPNFIPYLTKRFTGLTQYELVFISAHLMGLNTNQLADLLNISNDSVRKSRYRLKKKLGLHKEDNFLSFIHAINSESKA
jgi:DNA-binding response OmpR family regulator